jgi:primosomal protein N' (replication factor Y)
MFLWGIRRVYAVPRSLFEPDRPTPSLRGATLLRVAVERGIDRGGLLRDWDALTYLAPDPGGGDTPVLAGELITVPLGKSDTPTRGFVVEVGGEELAAGIPPETLKPILARSGARIPEPLVGLGVWMAGYYLCPLGMAMSTMVPAAVKARTGRRVVEHLERSDPVPELTDLTPKVRAAWDAIRELKPGVFPLAPRDLADAIGSPTVREVNRLVALGGLIPVEREIVRAREEAGYLPDASALAGAPVLTTRQREVVEGIGAALGSFSTHLVHGVTGSGKTEVYLQLIERVVAGGGSAIVLVPEISLTPQASGRFGARFADAGVAVLHSGLTGAQRHREWKRASSGEARVVVGARSAVFAPLRRLGLIVVDEEHDTSYKQDQLPRYNARDVAIVRARLASCPVVLGSATPSLESWANAAGDRPRSTLWTMPDRVGGASLPRVELVDMATLLRPEPGQKPPRPDRVPALSPRLRGALAGALGRGEQALILLNRRGYAHYLCCASRTCGWVLECEHCDARLVIHTGRQLPQGAIVRCHHCLAEQVVPHRCPACSGRLLQLGTGTQRVEEELTGLFTAERVGEACALVEGETLARVDADTMRTGRDYFETLGRFASGEIKVLLGTQMIAKGHDFPNVSLVGVLCADAALALPDFRAAERTFQLVSQVAGRAGRGEKAGTVIVQAYDPEAPAVKLAARHDYPAFADAELAARRGAGLPPVGRMARVVCRDREFDRARAAAEALAGALRAGAEGARVEILGPSPCAIARVAGYHRFEVLLLAPTARLVQDCLGGLRARGLLKSDARTAIDVDPVALM